MNSSLRTLVVAAGTTLGVIAQSSAGEPLKVVSAPAVMEAGVLLLAIEKSPTGAVVGDDGGVPSLWVTSAANSKSEAADLAGNSETQLLRLSVKHPDARILLTVAEGLYRIIARRSAGISKLSDLKGKRIGTQADTSAAYFVYTALAEAGLTESDVSIVPLSPKQMTEALIARNIDAMAIWEPESERAQMALGADAIELQPAGTYRELYNLNTTSAVLADATKRAQVIAFVRTLGEACRTARSDPGRIHALLSVRTGYDAGLIASSWRHHRFPCANPDDLVDVLDSEEQWLANKETREPRSKAKLGELVDGSILKEAVRTP